MDLHGEFPCLGCICMVLQHNILCRVLEPQYIHQQMETHPNLLFQPMSSGDKGPRVASAFKGVDTVANHPDSELLVL